MRSQRLFSIPTHGVSFDTETHLVQNGLITPPLVCGSIGMLECDQIETQLLDRHEAIDAFVSLLQSPGTIISGANIAFDLAVMAVELIKRGVDVFPAVFRALNDDRVYDILIAEKLHAIANGHLGKNPLTGGLLSTSGKKGGYSLEIVTELVTGRSDAKANDEWRQRYAELEHIPIAQWPDNARNYPRDDVFNTHDVTLRQIGHLPKLAQHTWGRDGGCQDCGSRDFATACTVARPHRNLQDLSSQVGTAFAMYVGAAWGFRVNQASVDTIEREALRGRDEDEKQFVTAGLLRKNPDGSTSQDLGETRRRVALAYGADPISQCSTCGGTGKVPSTKTKSKINCKDCCATGLSLATAPTIPRTEKDGIGYGRDVLFESADETLIALADFQEDAKDTATYIPYLRRARTEDGRDIPLTLSPNVLVESGRTSYRGTIQQFKRKPGYVNELGEYIPSLRECIEARPGRVFSSEDYNAGELITHAQSCTWLVGYSALAQALLAGIDPHTALASTVLGIDYKAFNKKIKAHANARQAAKPFNFGKPGGMGDPKIVLQQRKQGPDTPHHSGPIKVKDETTGTMVPGYKGLRFCILMDSADACGLKKVTEWKKRPIPPTCAHCIECAARLSVNWRKQWPESEPYFTHINECVNDGMWISDEALDRWPHLREVYISHRLAPGEVMQHVSGRIRGGLAFCEAANTFFQGLLADIAKAALRRISWECYDRGVGVPEYLHENSVRSEFAGSESPLYGSRVIVFQHDEMIAEHPEAIAHEAATRISEVMRDEMRRYCPDLAGAAKAGPTLMRRWYKSADKVEDANGRLIPWEPRG